MPALVPELNVLVATSHWLHKQGWHIDSVSPATGSGLEPIDRQRGMILESFRVLNIPYDKNQLFRSSGPDILASCALGTWTFECKGLGGGKAQTLRNNFDRAVASVVSYYNVAPYSRLGLALASDYLREYNFADRVPMALRKVLNLWVFLVSSEGAHPYRPDEELPYPGAND